MSSEYKLNLDRNLMIKNKCLTGFTLCCSPECQMCVSETPEEQMIMSQCDDSRSHRRSNYCGGCNAFWYLNGERVDCK